ncbi:pseudaminic acid cytidylyltransferase [Oceanospirillum maris]|uniref:pseudaminic acid cytidylyltransferase n=1 Tax=Oceanospirillum maris TaxID=64977 RepID=UPI000420D9DB|nr:pseudaminic acid cytidylyltransferase [Oceanospirillum maris]
MNIAIIPARGGSKRIPRKNINDFFGKPMIAWSIEAALKSHCFDRVIVSTDDQEIAEVAQKYGAEVPFIRPSELANDFAGTIPVVKHATEWLIQHQQKPSLVCCLYATAPFVTTEDLQRGLKQQQQTNADYTFTVTSYPFPIQRAIKITPQNSVEMFSPEYFNTRSQDLEEAYHDAGQFYWGKADAWLEEKIIFSPESTPLVLPRHRVQDIDTPEDWIRAEMMFQVLKKNGDLT